MQPGWYLLCGELGNRAGCAAPRGGRLPGGENGSQASAILDKQPGEFDCVDEPGESTECIMLKALWRTLWRALWRALRRTFFFGEVLSKRWTPKLGVQSFDIQKIVSPGAECAQMVRSFQHWTGWSIWHLWTLRLLSVDSLKMSERFSLLNIQRWALDHRTLTLFLSNFISFFFSADRIQILLRSDSNLRDQLPETWRRVIKMLLICADSTHASSKLAFPAYSLFEASKASFRTPKLISKLGAKSFKRANLLFL